ncbi:MAG TPA: STAS domain-containing protein [Caldilineae bacterium]|nr:STAS domain-containing protein [Caldilineae bacterium]
MNSTFDIRHQAQENCDLFILSGRVDAKAAPAFELAVLKTFDNKRYKIVLNLADVSFMSSSGLRVLISLSQEAKKHWGGEVRLAAVNERILDVMNLAGLTSLFQIFDTVSEACESFS